MFEIPKILHLIWIQGEYNLPPPEKENLKNLRLLNYDWTVKVWNENDILNLLDNYTSIKNYYTSILPTIDSQGININASKSDIARWVIVYHYGGCYMDMDVKCVNNLNDIVQTIPRIEGHFIATPTFRGNGAYSQFFMSTERNEDWKPVFDNILKSAKAGTELGNGMGVLLHSNAVLYKFPKEVVDVYHCGKSSMCMVPIKTGASTGNYVRRRYELWCKYKTRITLFLLVIIVMLISILVIKLF